MQITTILFSALWKTVMTQTNRHASVNSIKENYWFLLGFLNTFSKKYSAFMSVCLRSYGFSRLQFLTFLLSVTCSIVLRNMLGILLLFYEFHIWEAISFLKYVVLFTNKETEMSVPFFVIR
uniref:(northern house mosquito) hypothetical protein n=1 Tax=Culex pipiens TaxID=7175 RepID=A0A8D8BRF2_CULPI